MPRCAGSNAGTYERCARRSGHAVRAHLALAQARAACETRARHPASEGPMTPDIVFRDPYLLDFVGLRGAFSERDLETALVRELGDFILELRVGFAFVERQKRITVAHHRGPQGWPPRVPSSRSRALRALGWHAQPVHVGPSLDSTRSIPTHLRPWQLAAEEAAGLEDGEAAGCPPTSCAGSSWPRSRV